MFEYWSSQTLKRNMVYPCFYYSLEAARKLDLLIYQTTEEKELKYRRLRKTISLFRFSMVAVAIFLNSVCTFLRSSQDSAEFKLRLFESISFIGALIEYLWVLLNLHKFINLMNLMKMSFSTLDSNIVQACKKKEKIWFVTFLTLIFLGKYIKYTWVCSSCSVENRKHHYYRVKKHEVIELKFITAKLAKSVKKWASKS